MSLIAKDRTKDVVRRLRAAGFEPPAGVPRFLGEGCDFRAWRIGERVYRIAKHDRAIDVLAREVTLGRALAPALPCAISYVERYAEDEGIAEYAFVEGRPAHRAEITDALASDLAAFFDALHGFDAASLEIDELEAPIAAWQDVVYEELDAIAAEPWVRAALDDAPDDGGARVLTHSDLAPEHVLVDGDGRLTAVIDWSDARISDPAIDLAGAWLFRDASFAERVLDRYRGPRDPELAIRARYLALCAAIHHAHVGELERREDWRALGRRALDALHRSFA
jgi:aminoglycoside phosphotransferase (APT) family kinase protein